MTDICVLSHFVVFCETKPTDKSININYFGYIEREVQRETILLQCNNFTIKITRKGNFTI